MVTPDSLIIATVITFTEYKRDYYATLKATTTHLDLFHQLVPESIVELLSLYESQKDDVIRKEKERVTEACLMGQTTIASLQPRIVPFFLVFLETLLQDALQNKLLSSATLKLFDRVSHLESNPLENVLATVSALKKDTMAAFAKIPLSFGTMNEVHHSLTQGNTRILFL